jgi:Mycothiol maleylpyruvate isomerase N-terminal domain
MERDELLALEEKGWEAFVGEARRVPEHRRADPGVVPGWSVNDLVFHVGKWAGVAADKLQLLAKGEPTDEDEDWESVNQAWAAQSKSMPYEQAMSVALQDRRRAREALEAMDAVTHEAEGWFKEETIDHYAEHADEIGRFADSLSVPEK